MNMSTVWPAFMGPCIETVINFPSPPWLCTLSSLYCMLSMWCVVRSNLSIAGFDGLDENSLLGVNLWAALLLGFRTSFWKRTVTTVDPQSHTMCFSTVATEIKCTSGVWIHQMNILWCIITAAWLPVDCPCKINFDTQWSDCVAVSMQHVMVSE